MQLRAILLATILVLPPLGARGANLVVWWEKGFYAQEDEAIVEVIIAFEQDTGKQVELVLTPQAEIPDKVQVALDAGQPPDFLWGFGGLGEYADQWVHEDRLVDLTEVLGPFLALFDRDLLERARLLNGRTGGHGLYALPMGRITNHVHVWRSLLERAGFTLADIPKEWEAFWAFWCDQVQPAVREALGRDDIWGVGLSMSAGDSDTSNQFDQFTGAYGADYVTRDGRLVIDDPEVQRRLIKAIDSYTAIYRKGCTPPDSVTWDAGGNNEAFLAGTVVMTPNYSLSIPNALKSERPDDYYENTATIEWPLGPRGNAFPIRGDFFAAVIFKDGDHVATAEEFVRFLVAEGWLAHYLDFAGERMLPPMPALLQAPFWLDPSDPHRMAAVMQAASRPLAHDYATASGDLRHEQIGNEDIWRKAVHRIVTEGISPVQAVDEAIARIKQILSE